MFLFFSHRVHAGISSLCAGEPWPGLSAHHMDLCNYSYNVVKNKQPSQSFSGRCAAVATYRCWDCSTDNGPSLHTSNWHNKNQDAGECSIPVQTIQSRSRHVKNVHVDVLGWSLVLTKGVFVYLVDQGFSRPDWSRNPWAFNELKAFN